MSIMTASGPVWANAEHTAINLLIEHEKYGQLPFTATPDDPEQHGRELFALALAGEFGEIAEYIAPPSNPVVVPQEISKAQGISIMMDRGIWATVKTYFEVSATQDEKELFAAVTVFNRASPLLLKVKALLDLDDAFVDQMFIDGAKKVI